MIIILLNNIKHANTKKLTTLAEIALCATGLAFTANSNVANAATVNPEYTVQSGDTLWTIAMQHDVDLNQLETLNGKDANNTLIVPGEKLKLPVNGQENVQTTNTNVQSANTQTTYAQPQQQVSQTSQQTVATPATNATGSESSAKEWIAQRESGGSYNARNHNYIGRYQLSSAYLNGDYSPANQERVAQKYVNERYGGWQQAKAFWQTHGWY